MPPYCFAAYSIICSLQIKKIKIPIKKLMFFYVNSIFITPLLTQLIPPAIIHFIFAAQVYFPLAYSYTRFNSGTYGAPPLAFALFWLLTQPKIKAFKEGMFAKFESIPDPTDYLFFIYVFVKAMFIQFRT